MGLSIQKRLEYLRVERDLTLEQLAEKSDLRGDQRGGIISIHDRECSECQEKIPAVDEKDD